MDTVNTRWSHVVVLVAMAAATGCSIFSDDVESQWRTLTVLHLQPRAELGSHVDARCLESANAALSDMVVVVGYRISRVRRFQAFPLPRGRSLHEGDTVVVSPGQCLLKDAASAS